MPKKETSEENEELEKLRKDILGLRKDAGKNYHRELLKRWLITAVVPWLFTLIMISIIVIVGHFTTLPVTFPEPIEPLILKEIAPIVFNATVTINALIIGFVPLITFFFIREVKDRERDFEQDWKEEQKKSKGEKLKLINTYYNLLLMLGYNIRTGILRYTQTYIMISVFLQFISISTYIVTMGYGNAALSLLLDFGFLATIITGIIPIIGIALYQPTLRFAKYIVGREITVIELGD